MISTLKVKTTMTYKSVSQNYYDHTTRTLQKAVSRLFRLVSLFTRGQWDMIRSPDKNSYGITANAMQLLPVLPQQLGHKFDHTIKRSKVILVLSFQQILSPWCCIPRFSLRAFLVQEKKILTIYWHGSHLVLWCRTIWTSCQHPFDRRPHVKLVKTV